jgi:tyrosinase
VLHDTIQTLAESFPPDKIDSYRDAAHSFRIPYWDWSQGDESGDVPDFFVNETVQVHTPEGKKLEMWNPLRRFDFNPVPQGFEGKVGSAHSDNKRR